MSFSYINKDFNNNLLIRQDLIPGIFIYNKETKKLIKIIENEGISTLLPFSIEKDVITNGYILTYFTNSNLSRLYLDKNFQNKKLLWNKSYSTVFHHWGDEFNDNFYLMGSVTNSFPHPFQRLYKNNFKDCRTGNFLNETIEIINKKMVN